MKALVAAIFRLVALTTLANGVFRLPTVLAAFDPKYSMYGAASVAYSPAIGVFLTFCLAYIFWIMAPAWAEKTVEAFPSSGALRVPDADWVRVGTALFGLYLVATGIAGLVSTASLWLWISKAEAIPNSLQTVTRTTYDMIVKDGTLHVASVVTGVLLYFGKDKIRFFWNRSS